MSSFDEKGSLPLASVNETRPRRVRYTLSWWQVMVTVAVVCFTAYYTLPELPVLDELLYENSDHSGGEVNWKSCGKDFDGFECANITVPLDHHNLDDKRTMSIAVTRFLATDKKNRKGAIFLNPGGPGGSGTSMAYTRGPKFSKIVKGQYDFIGFDPRGINLTSPYTSCFQNRLEEETFISSMNEFKLNLPANISRFSKDEVEKDLLRQVDLYVAATRSLANKCQERTGDYMAYFGTDAVVRDIDYLARKIEGQDMPVNFWGFSYGTVIGQYLVKILSPERIGRVIIDGVVDPDVWNSYATSAFEEGLDNIDDVLKSFASSCIDAGKNCSINLDHDFQSSAQLLSKIDETLDALYAHPVPIYDLDIPVIASARNLRGLLFRSMYSIMSWDNLASHLSAAFNGNFTGIVNATIIRVDAEHGKQHDDSLFSTLPIFCTDAKPYDELRPPPKIAELAELQLRALKKYSSRMGDGFFYLSLCHVWDEAGIMPRKSHYGGTFELPDDTLKTPILVLSNTYDPVTSLASAKRANSRLGNNARLIQQTDGWGHCSVSQTSFCTARIVRAFWNDGIIPSEKHTLCGVDQKPWQPFNDTEIVKGNAVSDDNDADLQEAWRSLAEGWHELF